MIDFNPCGMACDIGRRPYKTSAKLLADSDEIFELQWYKAAPDAKTLPFSSRVTSLDWLSNPESHEGIGEVYGAPRGYSRFPPPDDAPGNRWCGDRSEFRNGSKWVEGDPEVRYSSSGLPVCCGVQPDPGGVAIGGSAIVKNIREFRGTGGLLVGGTARVSSRIPYPGSGGLFVGGTVVPGAVGKLSGSLSSVTLVGSASGTVFDYLTGSISSVLTPTLTAAIAGTVFDYLTGSISSVLTPTLTAAIAGTVYGNLGTLNGNLSMSISSTISGWQGTLIGGISYPQGVLSPTLSSISSGTVFDYLTGSVSSVLTPTLMAAIAGTVYGNIGHLGANLGMGLFGTLGGWQGSITGTIIGTPFIAALRPTLTLSATGYGPVLGTLSSATPMALTLSGHLTGRVDVVGTIASNLSLTIACVASGSALIHLTGTLSAGLSLTLSGTLTGYHFTQVTGSGQGVTTVTETAAGSGTVTGTHGSGQGVTAATVTASGVGTVHGVAGGGQGSAAATATASGGAHVS